METATLGQETGININENELTKDEIDFHADKLYRELTDELKDSPEFLKAYLDRFFVTAVEWGYDLPDRTVIFERGNSIYEVQNDIQTLSGIQEFIVSRFVHVGKARHREELKLEIKRKEDGYPLWASIHYYDLNPTGKPPVVEVDTLSAIKKSYQFLDDFKKPV